MTSRGAAMSPTTEPVARTSSCSLALTFPVTGPLIVTFFATKSALIVALGPMVKLWSPSSIDPSTWRSTVKSSVLMTLPSTRTDLPIHPASRRSLTGALGSVASPGRTRSPELSPLLIRSLRSGCQLAIAERCILLAYSSHENRPPALALSTWALMALQRKEFRMPRPKAAPCRAAARETSAGRHLFTVSR